MYRNAVDNLSEIVLNDNTPICGIGEFGRVFAISDIYVAKLFFPLEDPEGKLLSRECKVHTKLYELGIQVPKPEGIIEVYLEFAIKPETAKAMVSQRIYGIDMDCITKEHREVANKQLTQQLKQAKTFGYHPFWDYHQNAIFNIEEQKLYLIDFHQWKKD